MRVYFIFGRHQIFLYYCYFYVVNNNNIMVTVHFIHKLIAMVYRANGLRMLLYKGTKKLYVLL